MTLEHGTLVVPDVEVAQAVEAGAIFAFSLDVNLPLPSETVEVVYEHSPHERLDRAINLVQRHALFEHFFTIDIDELLRHGRKECTHHGTYFLALLCRGHELVQVIGQKLDVSSSTIFEHESESTRCSDAGNCRRRKTERESVREF